MAEVIIPPEELEPELPEEQLPEIEKPTEKSKVISVDFNPLNTKQTASLDTHESFYTTDTDAWIVLNVGDMNEPTGQYSLALINKEDGSIFQRVGDIVQGVAYYKLLPNEIKHAGRWVGQAVITLANGNTTASRFSFTVSGHILDGKDVREIVIQDFQTLMVQLNDLKDNSTNEFGLLKSEIEAFQTTIQENEDERQATELGRVAAEIIREENYESKVDAAIVEADVVEKVDNKVAELAPTIQQVTEQLAQTGELADKTEYNTMGKGKSDVRPVITFVTDDARTQDWTIFREMFADIGLPVSTAVSPNRNINTPDYGNVYLTVDKIRELQDDYGWEILSHTWDHENLPTLTDEELDGTLKKSRDWLRDNGFHGYEFLMYPFGTYDERVKRFTAKYYKAARTTAGLWGGVENKFPFASYQLSARFFSQTITLDMLKADVDRCIANKTWLNLFFHSWEIDDWNREADFRALLDYVKEKQTAGLIDVMGYKDTYERYGNMVDQSSYALESDDMFIIQSNGKVRSNIAKTKKLANNSVTNDSLPSDFPANFLSFVTITQADKGFPTTNGTLETLYFTPNENEPTNMRYTRQTFYPHTSSQVYTRSYLSNVWSPWVLQGSGGSTGSGGFAIITGSSVDGTTIPSAFPAGQLTLYSKGSNTVGIPTTLGGVLSVFKVSTSFSFWYQEFKVVGSNDVWRRYATSENMWSTWVRVDWASGITANRPTGVVIGYDYYDGTLGKPIWHKGNNVWVDATGATV